MKRIILIASALILCSNVWARPTVGQEKAPRGLNKTAAGCNQSTATIDLDINNVRARIMSGGDMWWDRALGNARYVVPKDGNASALFAGSIWIGGIDQSTNDLKVAAQTYRSAGNDYWTGPLDEFNGASVDFQTCSDWDRFWKVNASDIIAFRRIADECNNNPSCIVNREADIAESIKEWPGRGTTQAKGSGGGALSVPSNRPMAPFKDADNDDVYDWRLGDYPDILGDQYIWYVFNDKGDIKGQTQSDAIGVEVHLGAFAFSTNDCLNDATFYNYRVHNWSTSLIQDAYMATWTDADMGFAFDDYIGSDTARGLGILYNGDAFDEGPIGYGYDIPMVGVDFFRGPRIEDSVKPGEYIELQMSVFTYFNNSSNPQTGDPQNAVEFYRYMTGLWRNGAPFVEGCVPSDPGQAGGTVFPDDPCKGGAISEPACNNAPNDRRFVHSAGPFELVPGKIPDDITIGCVVVPDAGSGSSACFSKILICDDKAQALFDNNFDLPEGPQAPDMNITPLDRKLVFELSNPQTSNNAREGYGTIDSAKYQVASVKPKKLGFSDSLFKFEGYIVYQLRDANVSLGDIRSKDGSINTDVARIVYQCDKENHVEELIEFVIDPEISDNYYTPRLMVSGANDGIRHSFQLTDDAFAATTSKELVNYKTYHYIVYAYAYNNFDNDNEVGPPSSIEDLFDPNDALNTQDLPYIESRRDGRQESLKIISVSPHPADDSLYVQTYADYGTSIQLTQYEGVGNGGIELELADESLKEILYGGNNQDYSPTYEAGKSPVEILVVNPNNIVAGDYELSLNVRAAHSGKVAGVEQESLGAVGDSTTWRLVNLTTKDTVYSERNIATYNDQILSKYGLSIGIKQVARPGDDDSSGTSTNALITSSVVFEDINLPWLSGIPDGESESFNNWIRSGEDGGTSDSLTLSANTVCNMNDWGFPLFTQNYDRSENYEKVIDGTWAPYVLTHNEAKDRVKCGQGYYYGTFTNRTVKDCRMQNLNSVDIVFTSDMSLWSKSAVVEMTDHLEEGGNYVPYGLGDQFKFNIRKGAAWDKGVDANGNPVYSTSETGYSWFPGYAINVETGQRLNIFFGEESVNGQDNGNDMIWNPSSRAYANTNGALKWGGKHVVYVSTTKYDGCEEILNSLRLADAEPVNKKANSLGNIDAAFSSNLLSVYNNVMWVGNVIRRSGVEFASLKDGLIPTKTTLKIRVERPYANFKADPNYTFTNDGWPLYKFSTASIAPAKLGDDRNTYTNDKDALMDRIQPVPNPYYAYSAYESNRLDNRIKIINLPEKATIKIYTVDGTLIRTLQKNDPGTSFIDWDLKNNNNIPIASGMYLIHVNIDGVGEKVIKWFGAMRPVDITSF